MIINKKNAFFNVILDIIKIVAIMNVQLVKVSLMMDALVCSIFECFQCENSYLEPINGTCIQDCPIGYY